MKYSIVIPTYNHCNDLLRPCIESIQRTTDLTDIEVIVVANGCTDNTREYVESLGAPFKLLWYPDALGYTLATNAGIRVAQGEYVLLLNNDVEILGCPQNSWLDRLTAPFVNNPKMALTGTLKLHDPDINYDFIVFCCALVKRSVFEQLGLPDEIFSPGYGEDIDFSMRVLGAGLEWCCVDETKPVNGMHVGNFPIWHKGNKTFGEIPSYATQTVQKNRVILKDRYNNPEHAKRMKYSIVIPTYNHCDDLLRPCVESIFQYSNLSEIELIISANGCVDNTRAYIQELERRFAGLGLRSNFKSVWHDSALGYSRACNVGIQAATTDLIVLLNNDTILLHQSPGDWLYVLEQPFLKNPSCGISCIVKGPSEPAGHDFAIFFCVMIHRKVFDRIGLLNEEYGVGGGEDTEFSIECERAGFEVCLALDIQWNLEAGMFTGNYPIYHKGEGTVHDPNLVPHWNDVFLTNSLKLAKKYNPTWYQWRLGNHSERGVFFKGDPVAAREVARYTYAAQNLTGPRVFELGCSSGYGVQFMPAQVEYTGLDYDKHVIEAAHDQNWRPNIKFINADINLHEMENYDTIIAFEVIEHLDNGLEVVEKLKKHCDRLIISVPMLEQQQHASPYHRIYNLEEHNFPGFTFKYVSPQGTVVDQPSVRGDPNAPYLLLATWNKQGQQVQPTTNTMNYADFLARKNNYKQALWPLAQQDKGIYEEVIDTNTYEINFNDVYGREVIDIGANIGCFTSLMAYLGAKKVVAVEPVQRTFAQMSTNVKNFGFDNVVTLKNAVGSHDGGTIRINNNTDHTGLNSAYNVTGSYDEVSTISLNTLLKHFDSNNILLKTDCEGGEYDLLMTASDEDMARINFIAIEIHEDLHPQYRGSKVLHDRFHYWGFERTHEKRLWRWDYNEKGEQINWAPLPTVVEVWVRKRTLTAKINSTKQQDISWMRPLNELIYKEVVEDNCYSLSRDVVEGRSVIDIGSNIGHMAVMSANLGASTVIAVEPVEATYDKLRHNVHRSGFTNILPMRYVVTDRDGGQYKISTDNSNSGANSLYNVNQVHEMVPGLSLDTLIKLCTGNNILLKLDCEGAEYDILMSATPESMRRVTTIVLEVHADLHPVYKGREVLENKLRDLGFTSKRIDPLYLFNYDNAGKLVATRELPFSNQRWEKV